MMELFLRKAPNGELQRKLVAVRGTPVEEKSLGQQVVASIEALDGLDGSAVVKACACPRRLAIVPLHRCC
jgi:hypothetical protein